MLRLKTEVTLDNYTTNSNFISSQQDGQSQSHIKEAVAKARRGIGIIKYLSRYVNREVLDQVYKLRVRPHLEYGDILYHKYDP